MNEAAIKRISAVTTGLVVAVGLVHLEHCYDAKRIKALENGAVLFITNTTPGTTIMVVPADMERRIKALEDTVLRVPTNAPRWTNFMFVTNDVSDRVSAIPSTTNGLGLRPLFHEHFDTGFKLGYSCASRGGTREEGNVLMDAFRSNRPDIVSNWFELHK
jgi:hypothetical protein